MKLAHPTFLTTVLASALFATLLCIQPPAAAQSSAADVAADLRMAQDAAPFRRAADAFVATAMAGDAAQAQAMLSAALVARSGDAAIRRALETQILPFFASGKAAGRSVTITRTTDAAGQQGFAFYMWLQASGTAPQRPFTVYVVEEQGRPMVANVVPDRLVEGRHR
jgi:cell pole-organizing protein PopZ